MQVIIIRLISDHNYVWNYDGQTYTWIPQFSAIIQKNTPDDEKFVWLTGFDHCNATHHRIR